MAYYFLSDLHLCDDRPQSTALFIDFLNGRARNAQAIYILGDLLEYWIGDDTLIHAPPSFIAPMRALTDGGVMTYFMHGNRDFLIGADFATATGCILLNDPALISPYGVPTLLMHGDTLCTDDAAYQGFRAQVRDARWQQQFLSLPWEQRVATARHYRSESQRLTSEKPEYITDVNPQAVEETLRAHHVLRLIHGHTHRSAVHELSIDGRSAQRIVLADWYDTGSVLELDEHGYRFVALA